MVFVLDALRHQLHAHRLDHRHGIFQGIHRLFILHGRPHHGLVNLDNAERIFDDKRRIGKACPVIVQREIHAALNQLAHVLHQYLMGHYGSSLGNFEINARIWQTVYVHDTQQILIQGFLHTLDYRQVDFYIFDSSLKQLLLHNKSAHLAEHKLSNLKNQPVFLRKRNKLLRADEAKLVILQPD